MRHFRFGILLILTGLLFSVSLFGCGSSRIQSSTTPKHKIVLEFWTLQMLNFSDYIHQMIHTYEQHHPNVEIKWVDVPFSEGEKKALTSMLSPKTPDVINLNPDFSAILASRGALLDMNKWVSPAQKASYLPVSWQAVTLNHQAFGLPWYLSSAITIYNQKLLQAAGYSTPPKTYAEMAQMAKVIHAKTGNYLLMPSISEGGHFFRTLTKAGIPIWNAQNKLVFADNGAGKMLQFWVNLYQQNLVPKESVTEVQQAAIDRYQSGTLALLLTGPNFLKIIRENAPQLIKDTNVAPQFPQNSNYMDFSQMILVVPKRTQHPKEAVDFALFVTNAENTLKLSELAPILPPHTSALNALVFHQEKSTDIMTKARSISAQQLLKAQTAMQIHPLQNQLNKIMDYYVQSALLGKLSPQNAMEKAQQDMNKLVE